MNEAQQWLNNRNRTYQDGLKIYNRHKSSNKHDQFFALVIDPKPSEPQYQILYTQLVTISRILGNTPAPEPVVKRIEVKTIATNDQGKEVDLDALRSNKQFINKLLTLGWDNLTVADKNIFYDNKDYYLDKQKSFFEISSLKNEMNLADAKRKESRNKEARKKYNDALNNISNKIRDIFKKKIDTWQDPQSVSKNADPDEVKKAVERERRIRYLKGTAIPRAKKELDNSKLNEKQKQSRLINIAEWEDELAELEKIHNI